MARRIAIAGASMGGLRAAEQLRSAGWEEEILVIGGEIHPPYNRPPLSKELLKSPGSIRGSSGDGDAAAAAHRHRHRLEARRTGDRRGPHATGP